MRQKPSTPWSTRGYMEAKPREMAKIAAPTSLAGFRAFVKSLPHELRLGVQGTNWTKSKALKIPRTPPAKNRPRIDA